VTARIDDDPFATAEKRRHEYTQTIFEQRRLAGSGGGLAAHGGIGFDDLQVNMGESPMLTGRLPCICIVTFMPS
jgi:hypothetical protein